MNLTIRSKLTLTISSALIILGIFFVTNMMITKSVVLQTEQQNVTKEVTTLAKDNLKGQIDTITLSAKHYYEDAKN